MASRKTKISTGDVSDTLIGFDGNTIKNIDVHETSISESLDQLSDTLYDIADQGRLEQYRHREQEHNEILETVFVSAVAGSILSWLWPSIMP